MGRAGGGGGRSGGGHSGGSRSGGGHSSSSRAGGSFGRAGGGHSSGGFRMSSGGKSSSGGSGGMGSGKSNPGSPGGMGTPPPGGRGRRTFFGFSPFRRRGYSGGYYRGAGGGCLTVTIIVIILVFVVSFAGMRQVWNGTGTQEENTTVSSDDSLVSGDSDDDLSPEADSSVSSDSSREKVESDLDFSSDCIIDELGWFDDTQSAGESLEDFFDATGVQPYIYLRSYDSSLTTDSEKDDYAQQWYEDNIENEQTFLYIYFAEEDTDNDVGYMSCVCGYDIEDIMDEEARELFWDFVDEYWPTNLSTDEMFAAIFNALADEIM